MRNASQVDWYELGTEAFEMARSENKPIFLSVSVLIFYLTDYRLNLAWNRSDTLLVIVSTPAAVCGSSK